MPIKSLLVHLATEAQAGDLMGIAASIAETSTAHLTALHVVPDAFIPAAVPPEVVGELIESQREANAATAAKIEQRYKVAAGGLRAPVEFRKVEAHQESVADVVIRNGRPTDLIVLGQSQYKLDVFSGIDTSEEIMLRAGRPVLMVPLKGHNGPVGKRILIAWKDTKEAARAVFDAMPFLTEADAVYILTIKQPAGRGKAAAASKSIPAADLAASLAHHEVPCEIVEKTGPDSTVGEEILAEVKARRCDLVVMGGYGHSRLREVIFGGTTHNLFETMPVPVLMSH